MRKFRHYSWQFIHYLKNRFFIDLNIKINGYIICQTSVWDSSYNLFALDKMSGVICGSALLWQKAAYWSLPRLGNETQPVTQKRHLWNKPKAGWRWVNSLNTIFNLKVRASAQLYLSLRKTLIGVGFFKYSLVMFSEYFSLPLSGGTISHSFQWPEACLWATGKVSLRNTSIMVIISLHLKLIIWKCLNWTHDV